MFSSRCSRLILGVFGCALAQVSVAQLSTETSHEDFYNLSLAELGKIQISIATGNATAVEQAPATATVISAAEIEAMGARTLDDILTLVPGLHVSLSSLSRLDSVYSVRGIHTGFNAQVLLLINGEPLQNLLQGGRPTLLRLAASNIERVEVIRGPGSAIYGADAYAGVINVITRDSLPKPGVQVGARLGSFDSHELWVGSSGQWRDWTLAFNMAYQETQGDQGRRIDQDLQSTLDNIFGTQVSLAPGPLATGYQNLDTRLRISHEHTTVSLWSWLSRDAELGAGGAQALDPEGHDNIRLWKLDIQHELDSSHQDWHHSIAGSYLYYDIDTYMKLFPSDSLLPIGSDGNLDFANPVGVVHFTDGLIGNPSGTNRDTHLYWVSTYEGWAGHRWRISVGYRYQELSVRERKNFGPGLLDGSETSVDGTLIDVTGTPYIYSPDATRRLHYVSLQDEWQLAPSWALTAGLRYDRYADWGGTTNPRVALVWTTNDHLTTKLLYGSAFRAPSISETRLINNPVSLGNPRLQPERIDTYELAFNYRLTDSLQTNLTLFNYYARDMIEFMPDLEATTSTAQNARNQKAKGFEWELQWKPSGQLWLTGSYSWQDAQDSDSGASIADTPGQLIKFNAYWEFQPNWYTNLQVYSVIDRNRSMNDSRSEIADYTLANVSVRRKQLIPNLDVAFTLRNFTDKLAREPSSGSIPNDYPLEGRSVWLEFNYAIR